MDKIIIQGGRRLAGTVEISGAKNAVLPGFAASLLTEEEVHLHNIPKVRDVNTFCHLLASLGVMPETYGKNSCRLKHDGKTSFEADYNLVKTIRASILVLGPLLSRYGHARVSLPGGCAIGARPVDMHIEGLKRLGAAITIDHGYIEAKAKRLRGAEYSFNKTTVTGTENLLMAATLAKGRTTLKNCAVEPEIEDLAELLISMGAKIKGQGTTTIIIDGVEALKGADHTVIPDRIETGTFMIAAAITGGGITLRHCLPETLTAVIDKLRETGIEIITEEDSIEVKMNGSICPADMETLPYPAFPTDMQAQYMALMTRSNGVSVIKENIFENRFMHIAELKRMGASIEVSGRTAVIKGGTSLSGARVMATDLRASASLILAGLVAEGETVVDRIYHIDRGYEGIEKKLGLLGARIERVKS